MTRALRNRFARLLAIVLSSLWGAALLPAAVAQSVSPVIVEYHGGAGTGSFDVTNDTLSTLVVTLEPKSFAIDRKGDGAFRRLDAAIHVSLSERSLRLPPKSRRTVLYKASAEAYPAWFSVYATFHGLPKENGVNVALELPHTVYLLGDAKAAKAARGDLRFEDLRVDERGLLTGAVHNVSAKMLRVTALETVQGRRSKVNAGGFPLLPGGAHEFQVQLASGAEPGKVVARFGGVSVEQGIGDRE